MSRSALPWHLEPPPHESFREERDRYAFYWDMRSYEPTDLLRLHCDEFRHQGKSKRLEIVVSVKQGASSSGAIVCHVSAANLPTPAELLLPVRTECEQKDTEEHVRGLLQELPRRPRQTWMY